jgi:hypothetical protein
MEILEHLFTPYRKRLYFGISIGAIALLLFVQFLVMPWLFGEKFPGFEEVLKKIVEHLIVAAVTSTVLTGALLFFTPPDSPESQTKVIKPPDRGRVIETTRHDTDSWWFSGGLGKYTRASTLPELNKQAHRNNKTTAVNLHLLDLRKPELCQVYANYRRTAWSAKHDAEPWTARRVQIELAATLTAAAAYQMNSRLTVRVRYVSQVSVFRTDLGDRGAILTQEDTRMEALFFGRESGGYAALREQLRLEEQYLPDARLPKIKTPPDELSAAALKEAIVDSDLQGLDLKDLEIDRIVQLAKSNKHPYS